MPPRLQSTLAEMWTVDLAARVPEKLRAASALLLVVILITVVFATIWLVLARRRAHPDSARARRLRAKRGRRGGDSAWAESARRLRLPPDDNAADDDTRDIDPSDLSPGDVDLRPGEDDEPDDTPGGPDRRGDLP